MLDLKESGSDRRGEFSQTSRHELLRKQREEKQARATPYEPNRVEEQMVRLDKAETPTISDWNLNGFYPRIAWPSRGSGAALGFRYWQPDFWGRVDAAGAAFYSLRQYQHYDIQLGLMPHVGRRIPRRSWRGDDVYDLASLQPDFTRFPFYVTMRFRYLPEEDFYGLGPDSSLENRRNYLREESRIVIVYRSGLTKGTGVLSGARRIDVTMSITRIPL